MGPTHNDRQPNEAATSQPGLFDEVETNGRPSEVTDRVSAEPNAPLGEPLDNLYARRADGSGPVLVAPPPSNTEPIWLKRIKLVIFVLFCVELGMLLSVLPWTRVWTDNSILLSYPALREILRYDFVRGAISGLGLVDIWLGIREAVNYREK